MALYWPPKLKKRIPSNLGGQFATPGAIVQAFISKLGANLQPKNAPSWPQVCLAQIPSVKRPLGYIKQSWPQVRLARTPSVKRALGYIKQSWPQVFFWARTPNVERALGYKVGPKFFSGPRRLVQSRP
jgi:hypothetical protein